MPHYITYILNAPKSHINNAINADPSLFPFPKVPPSGPSHPSHPAHPHPHYPQGTLPSPHPQFPPHSVSYRLSHRPYEDILLPPRRHRTSLVLDERGYRLRLRWVGLRIRSLRDLDRGCGGDLLFVVEWRTILRGGTQRM